MKESSKTALMLLATGILAGYIGIVFPINQPYKEVCTCNTNICYVTRYYLNRQVNDPFILKKDIVIKEVRTTPGGYRRGGWPTYRLMPVFELNYHTKFGAQRDYDAIISSHKSHTTRHNFASIWLFILALFALKASYEHYKEEK